MAGKNCICKTKRRNFCSSKPISWMRKEWSWRKKGKDVKKDGREEHFGNPYIVYNKSKIMSSQCAALAVRNLIKDKLFFHPFSFKLARCICREKNLWDLVRKDRYSHSQISGRKRRTKNLLWEYLNKC